MQATCTAARTGIRPAAARFLALVAVPLALVAVAGLHAHHGSADHLTDRAIVVSGTVKEFRWANRHVWVYLTVAQGSEMAEWNGEGPPRDARGGLIKRIERDGGDTLVVSRPWLDTR